MSGIFIAHTFTLFVVSGSLSRPELEAARWLQVKTFDTEPEFALLDSHGGRRLLIWYLQALLRLNFS